MLMMMENRRISQNEILESILRGAAKILGCGSANLIVFNRSREEIRIQVGLVVEKHVELGEVEQRLGLTMGLSLNDAVYPFALAQETLIFKAWRDRIVLEASSIQELAKNAFPDDALKTVDDLIGNHRYICVPITSEVNIYGVIVFEKSTTHPFSPQQREILIRYANRIGEIIENDARSSFWPDQRPSASDGVLARYLIGKNGVVKGESAPRPSEDPLPSDVIREAIAFAGDCLASDMERFEPPRRLALSNPDLGKYEIDVTFMKVDEIPHALCDIRRTVKKADSSIQAHLLQIAFCKSAPALLVDPAFRITSCNESTQLLLGYSEAELIGRDIATIFKNSQDIRTILNHQFLFISNGHYEETTTALRKNGEEFVGKVEAVLLADEKNRVVGYLVLLTEPHQEPSDADCACGRMQLSRQERLASMGEMAAQLAHEIRNPLLAIGASLESMELDLHLDKDSDEMLRGMSREISRLDMILKDYLSLAVKQNAGISRISIREVIDDVRNILLGLRKTSGKRIEVNLPQDLHVFADYEGMKHVFFNLLLNGLEACPGNSVVTCHADSGDKSIVIYIDDEGPGISSGSADYFAPFYTTKKNGTGLGLTVCRKIVTTHGGTIELKNRAGGGCRAEVFLPKVIAP
ncbi:MAG: PAS domain-containing protein [Myxococcales bacterium]|nr:MAG: PAS domain-containing protein [Myxococcales bacterium]